jgi:hypothetical protein
VRGQLDSDIDLGGSSGGSSTPLGDGTRDGRTNWVKWGTTGGAAVLLGTSIGLYFSAKSYNDKLVEDSHRTCNPSPCQFDVFAQDLQSTGKTLELWSNVTLVAGVATAGVAGYFWYKDLTRPRRTTTRTAPSSDEARAGRGTRFVALPLLGDGVVGGTAVIEF